MKIFAAHGVQEFVICCGYKGYHDQGVLLQLFPAHVRRDLRYLSQHVDVHQNYAEPWKVTVVDTGPIR